MGNELVHIPILFIYTYVYIYKINGIAWFLRRKYYKLIIYFWYKLLPFNALFGIMYEALKD